MQSFLEEVVNDIWLKHKSFDSLVFILPSKRAGTFLKNTLAKVAKKNIFAPKIYAIEGFVEEVSGITYASNTQQLFELYNSYLKTITKDQDDFYAFSKWGQTLLQDFNEIDRYLVDTKKLFPYLSAIKELDYWDATKMMKEFIKFWNNLEQLYSLFNKSLLEQNIGHQGLVYRTACNTLETYLSNTKEKHIFIGFNALNTAEEYLIQEILENGNGDIYWDTDSYFIDDPIHDASYFIRQHKKNWSYFNTNTIKGIGNNYNSNKKITIIGVPKNVSQTKYVGELLGTLKKEQDYLIKNTAVVLGDETLLNPLINSVPEEIDGVNITMGYPLHKTPVAGLFSQLFELYTNPSSKGWYFKDILNILCHPYIQILFNKEEIDGARKISETIKRKNWIYVPISKIEGIIQDNNLPLSLVFFDHPKTSAAFIEKCIQLIEGLKTVFITTENKLGLEYIYRFYKLFNQLHELVKTYPFIADVKTLFGLYKELIASETLDFQGEPLEGLQIMGMLESRNLDFETVILTSVNEGILPSGKSNNSFIPFDVKMEYGLPTYKEKDAVYTYHFYRLLHRAKNIYLIYNTEPDVLEGGEKSRLISQLLTDENIIPNITQIIATPKISATIKKTVEINKDKNLLRQIQDLAKKGFSPSSLSNYIRNPLDFYKQSILKINDSLEVEENVAANTFGTIIHDSLEELYTPFVGKYLTKEMLLSLKPSIPKMVTEQFKKTYLDGDITTGKNLIAYNVALKYVEKFIDIELKEIEKHQIKILGLEQNLNINLNYSEVDFPIVLKGKLDRIDEKNGVLRIIDYKTGKVLANHVKITNWEDITKTYDKSKAFQLMCYALMYNPNTPIEAGIYSFKNLKSGFLPFKEDKNTLINTDTIKLFQEHLKDLIMEILNPEIPFIEKEV